jgi:hypothetical protein
VPVQADAEERKKKRRIERAINEVDVGWRCCFPGALFLSFFFVVCMCVRSPFFDLLIYNPAPSDSNGAMARAAGGLKIFTGTSAAAAAAAA